MSDLKNVMNILHDDAEARYNNFQILNITSIKSISEDSYLEAPVWVGGDQKFACLFIDLDGSSKRSFKSHPKTMAQIYDYFTQSLFDVMSNELFKADYLDIKGDGVFGIYEGGDAVLRAFVAAKTFSTFFDEYIRPKFQAEGQPMNFKAAIHYDKLLVKRIGTRGARNNNEVWAGRLVNKAAKLCSVTKDIYENTKIKDSEHGLLVVSHPVYQALKVKSDYTIMSCGHTDSGENGGGNPVNLWQTYGTNHIVDLLEDEVYYNQSNWCKICGDSFIDQILS